jgi:hypothetical protein
MAAESSFVSPYGVAEDVPASGGHRQIGRHYQKTVIHDDSTSAKVIEEPEIPEKPGDRHLIISIVLLIISIINPFALIFAILALVFSLMSRSAEMKGLKEEMQSRDKIAFGFAIFSIIAWILTICGVIFGVYMGECGLTGEKRKCRPQTLP